MKKVLLTEPVHPDGLNLLRARPDVELIVAPDIEPETLSRLMPGMHGILVRLAQFPAELLELSSDLQVVSRHGVGCDAIEHRFATLSQMNRKRMTKKRVCTCLFSV